MAEQYSGTQVYHKIQDTIGFLQKRTAALERDATISQEEFVRFGVDITKVTQTLGEAYVRDSDLRQEADRHKIKDLTGKDLAYVVEEHEKAQRHLQQKKDVLEGDRLYLMRESVAMVPLEEAPEGKFADERLNRLVQLEVHQGYQELMRQGYTAIRSSPNTSQQFLDDFILFWKYASPTYSPGLLGFKHRRLHALAQATASDLGYTSFEEMEHGMNGRAEQRWSIPILLINPDLSIMDVKARVDTLLATHTGLVSKLSNSERELRDYAARELAEHFTVTRAENLQSGGIREVQTHLTALLELYSERDQKEEEIKRNKREQSDLTKRILKLSEVLESNPGLEGSSETISARAVDEILASPSPDYKSLNELDAMIKREFPGAASYRYEFRRENPGRSSRSWQETAQKAGGVGKWTAWRKI